MVDFDVAALAFLALGLAAGGITKGFSGSGLPTVSVASMALVIDVPTAVALMPIPLLPRGHRTDDAQSSLAALRKEERTWRITATE